MLFGSHKVTHTTLHQDDNGKPGHEVKSFRVSDWVQHISAHLDGLDVGKIRIRWVFSGSDREDGEFVTARVFEEAHFGVANRVSGKIFNDKDFPFGFYRAELFIDDQPMTSVTYPVISDDPTIRVTDFRLHRDNGKGQPGERMDQVTPQDRTIHFVVELNGFIAAHSDIKLRLAAADEVLGTLPFDLSTPGNTLTVDLTYDMDWPPGNYVAEIYLDGAQIGVKSYEVGATRQG